MGTKKNQGITRTLTYTCLVSLIAVGLLVLSRGCARNDWGSPVGAGPIIDSPRTYAICTDGADRMWGLVASAGEKVSIAYWEEGAWRAALLIMNADDYPGRDELATRMDIKFGEAQSAHSFNMMTRGPDGTILFESRWPGMSTVQVRGDRHRFIKRTREDSASY